MVTVRSFLTLLVSGKFDRCGSCWTVKLRVFFFQCPKIARRRKVSSCKDVQMERASSGSHTENLLPFAPFKCGSVLNSPDPGFSDPTGLHWKSSKKAATPEVDWVKLQTLEGFRIVFGFGNSHPRSWSTMQLGPVDDSRLFCCEVDNRRASRY